MFKPRRRASGKAWSPSSPRYAEREGNRIQLLRSGGEYFPDLLQALALARFEIRVETYIFADDALGESVAMALRDAAARGVRVRLILDGFGGKEGIRTWVPLLRSAGVWVRIFRPEGWSWKPHPWRLRRMHRKVVVIDRRLAWVGGINLIDDMNHDDEQIALGKFERRLQRHSILRKPGALPVKSLVNTDLLNPGLGPRYDFAVRLEGPIVQDVWSANEWLWWHIGPNGHVIESLNTAWWKKRYRQVLHVLSQQALEEPPPAAGSDRAVLVLRDNLKFRREIEKSYLQAMGQARHSIVIANAYFIPSRRFRKALLKARERGVRVQLLLQGQVEYKFQHYATQAMYEELLRAGVEIHEYMPSFLHAKVAVVDEEWATVGSSNIDPFSFLLAREANVIVKSADFSAGLRQELEQAILVHSRPVVLQAHIMRPVGERLYSALCYGLLRVAVLLGALTGRY